MVGTELFRLARRETPAKFKRRVTTDVMVGLTVLTLIAVMEIFVTR